MWGRMWGSMWEACGKKARWKASLVPPSYTSPHANVYTPRPERLSLIHWPTKCEPDLYLISPCPWRS